MAGARDIRRRIKGVKSTGKITRAMEMISAVKMRKAVSSVLAIRPYAKSALRLLRQLNVAVANNEHLLLRERPIRRELYVVVASNRGLCGAFNSQIVKRLLSVLKEDIGREHCFITIGKKSDMAARRFGWDVIASFSDVLSLPTVESMRPITKIIIDEFESGRVDRVVMVYMDYISVLKQIVKVRGLLPVSIKDTEKALNEMDGAISDEERGLTSQSESAIFGQGEYMIEPSPKKVLWRMIPRLIEMELYHAILESNASQESARMLAMQSATNSAKDMVAGLTLAYNQLRQSKITQEIAELSAGMAAVS
jgi:F-type H+-transporting ATPase subunit gamma